MSVVISTRSSESADAHRDFDNFDVDEELRRFRVALRQEDWRAASELAANIDESLSRGGDIPVAWLGPTCMQEETDIAERLASVRGRAEAMTMDGRLSAVGGYVKIDAIKR